MNAPIIKPPTVHRALIQELCNQYPEVRTHGFFRALRNLPDADYTTDLLTNDDHWARRVRFVPDAWAIDYEAQEITIFEVVVKHDITVDKFGRIVDLAWALDEDYWALGLVRCDEAGRYIYDPQAASLCSLADNPGKRFGEVPNWMRYTYEQTEARLSPPTISEPARLTNPQVARGKDVG